MKTKPWKSTMAAESETTEMLKPQDNALNTKKQILGQQSPSCSNNHWDISLPISV